MRVAKQYIDMEHLTIVIVGDRASIEAPLRATGIAPITLTDIEGEGVQVAPLASSVRVVCDRASSIIHSDPTEESCAVIDRA